MPDGGSPIEKILVTDSREVVVEKMNKAVAYAENVARTAHDRGEKIAQLDALTKDLTEQVRDAHAQLALQSQSTAYGNSDAEIREFVDESAGRVRMTGGFDHATGVYRSGLLDDDVEPVNEWHAKLRELKTQQGLVRICTKPGNSIEKFGASAKTDILLREHMERAPASVRKIFNGTTGAGGDWQQTVVLPTLAEEARLPLAIEALFDTVDMPAKSVKLPFDAGVAVPYRKGAPSANPPGQYTPTPESTTARDMTADSLAVMVMIFDDADEDSVIAAKPLLSRKVVDALRYGREDCIINGDAAATHQDTLSGWNPRNIYVTGATFGGADDHRRSWIGLRAHAFDASSTRDASGDTTSWTTQTLKAARSALSAPHGVDGDLVYVASLEHYLTNIFVDSNVLTADKMGDRASILTGQVAMVGGVRVVVSEFLTADLAATGLRTGSGSKTGGLLFNRRRFWVGNRRGSMLEADKDIRSGVHYLVATWRGTFRPLDGYTHKSVHFSYNL